MIIGHTVKVDLRGAVGTTYLTQNQGGSTGLLSCRLVPCCGLTTTAITKAFALGEIYFRGKHNRKD